MKFPDFLPVFGDTDFRGECPLEEAEQATFFSQLRKLHPEVGDWHPDCRPRSRQPREQSQLLELLEIVARRLFCHSIVARESSRRDAPRLTLRK